MCRSERKHLLVLHVKYVSAAISLFVIYLLVGIGCPVYKFLGFRCPTCGVTRALCSLFVGDLEQYFSLSPFAILLIVAVVIGIHLSAMPVKLRRYGVGYIIITTASNLCWYLYSFA